MKIQLGLVLGFVFLLGGIILLLVVPEDPYRIGVLHLLIAGVLGGGSLLSMLTVRRTAFGSVRKSCCSVIAKMAFIGIPILGCALFVLLARTNELFEVDTTDAGILALNKLTLERIESSGCAQIEMTYVAPQGSVPDKLVALLRRFSDSAPAIRWRVVAPESEPFWIERKKITALPTLLLECERGDQREEARIVGRLDEPRISAAMASFQEGNQQKVGFLSGHGEPSIVGSDPLGLSHIGDLLKGEGIKVSTLSGVDEKEVSGGIDTIVITSPAGKLLSREVDLLVDYVARGGGVVVFHDPLGGDGARELVERFHIAPGRDVVLQPRVKLYEGPVVDTELVVSPSLFTPSSPGGSEDTAGKVSLALASSVRALEIREGSTSPRTLQPTSIREFMTSSAQSWAEKDIASLQGESPTAVKGAEDIAGPVPLAVAAEFSGGGRVMVFGDADFVRNQYIGNLSNAELGRAAIQWASKEWLSKSGSEPAPVHEGYRKVKVQISPSLLQNLFVMTGIVLPELILLIGLGVWLKRKYA